MRDVNAMFNGRNLRSVAAASALSPRAVMRAVLAAEKERSQLLSLAESGVALSQSQLERLRQLQEAALPQDSHPSLLPASPVRQSPPSGEPTQPDARASARRSAASMQKRSPR